MATAAKKKTAARLTPYHHGNLRLELIEAGLDLIAEKGVKALTLREIGSRLGVSRTAAYRHFANKTELLNAVRDAGFTEFGEALEKARQEAGAAFPARLAAMGSAYLRFARERPAHFQVMFDPDIHLQDADPDSAGARAFNVLLDTVRQAQKRGEVRLGDPMMVVSVIWGMIHGASVLRLDQMCPPENTGIDFAAACTGLLLSGVQDRHWTPVEDTAQQK